MKIYELKKGDILHISEKETIEFIKMDGMWGHWNRDGEEVAMFSGVHKVREENGEYHLF